MNRMGSPVLSIDDDYAGSTEYICGTYKKVSEIVSPVLPCTISVDDAVRIRQSR